MSGTKAGGLKAEATNKELYGANYYITIGKMGGEKSRGGGFAYNRELAKTAGAKGGTISRRPHKEKTHCLRGHEYTEDNTYRTPSSGFRSCKMCRAIKYQEKKHAA